MTAATQQPTRYFWAVRFPDEYHIAEQTSTPGGTSKYLNRDGSKCGYVFGCYTTFNEAKDACEQHANREAEGKDAA